MGSRAEADAEEFERVTDQLVELCESFSDDQWDARCPGEGWSIGAVAHHVAEANRLLVERLSQPLGTVTDDEMAMLEYFAARGESDVALPFTSGLARGTTKPFSVATRGIGHVDLRLEALPRKRAARH